MVNLNVKSNYSLLSSMLRIDDIIKVALDNKSKAAFLCDNNMYGVMEFYKKCRNNNIKPIIGVNIHLELSELYLYCRNYDGYKNIIKLTTIQNEREVNINDLEKYNTNLVTVLKYDNIKYYDQLKNIFDMLYIGVDNKEQEKNALNVTEKVIFFKECLYLERKDSKYLNYLYLIRDGKTISDEINYDIYHKELLNNTDLSSNSHNNILDIISMCDLLFPKSEILLPVYKIDNNMSPDKYLFELAKAGLRKRLGSEIPEKYQKRLSYELNIIKQMGFPNYFLVVYDFIKYAKTHNILVGPGRGSAAGSLVAYALGITEIDPLEYDLLFERFLNPERVTMPDIDVDFDSEKRNLVIDYVTHKYGEKRATGIITFNTLGAKQVIRDLGRCMNLSLPIIDDLAKSITSKELKDSYVNDAKFHRLINSRSEYKKLYDIALKLEGLPRHISIHAAGIVMSRCDIDEIIPLYKNPIGIYTTAFSKDYLEPLGLLKMDFLGLDNLTLMSNVIDEIRRKENINISFDKIPLDDKKTLDIFYNVDTDGIFQFESTGMKRFLSKLKVKSFEDIATALALYRPGPMDNIDSFIRRREGKEVIDYIHPDLEDILKPTYGIIIYQEQIMQIVRRMAGYSYGEADILRRAMSKKKESIILEERPKFIKGSLENGYSEDIANKVYDLILKFANYGFNKAHSISYAVTAYKMAFIKTYFLKYFISAMLTNVIGNNAKTNIYLNRARMSGITILPPDINESTDKYFAYDNFIRCPLSIISNVGTSVSNDIIHERENGKFTDFCDFVLRMEGTSVNQRVITNLISAGAISFGYNRKTLIQNIDNVINYADIAKDAGMIEIEKPEMEIYDEYSKEDVIKMELKTLGFYLSLHPASKYRKDYIVTSMNIKDYFDKNIKMALLISNIRETTTKNNDVMAFVVGSDEYGDVSLTIFPNVYSRFNNIKINDIIEISGRVERRFDKYQIVVNSIKILE